MEDFREGEERSLLLSVCSGVFVTYTQFEGYPKSHERLTVR